jgi:hypothetical protein
MAAAKKMKRLFKNIYRFFIKPARMRMRGQARIFTAGLRLWESLPHEAEASV